MKSVKLIGGAVALLVAIVIVFSIFSIELVDSANEGIKVNKAGTERGVDDAVVVSGWVFYNDLYTDVHQIPLSERTVDYAAFQVTTVDNAVFTIDPTIRYNMIKGNGPRIFVRFRQTLEQIEPTVFRQVIYNASRDAANLMTSDSLMSNRAIFENAVLTQATQDFAELGFNLVALTSGLTPPGSLTKAIEAKNVAIQDAIKYTNQAKAEKAKAEITIAQAQGEADAEIARARGRYEAAVYDAKATREKAQALTPLIVEMEKIKKWDGSLRTNDLGTGASPIINVK